MFYAHIIALLPLVSSVVCFFFNCFLLFWVEIGQLLQNMYEKDHNCSLKDLKKRPGTDHVILGPMRGLEINYMWRGRIHISIYPNIDIPTL